MNKELLPKKGATAIQNKLQKIRQNEMSISDYGKQITELFVDLTISQANGNSECYTILKPINEKQAIKQFSDGLRNRRLSTIISARNYNSLKDAIQAAQDEETSSSAAGEVLGMYKRNFFYNRHFGNNPRFLRPSRNYRVSSYRGHIKGLRGYKAFAGLVSADSIRPYRSTVSISDSASSSDEQLETEDLIDLLES